MKIKMFGTKVAYLYRELEEEIVLELPKGYKGRDEEICRLQKSIYGLALSRRCWIQKIHKLLTNVGLNQVKSDLCVYSKVGERGTVNLGIYADDIIIIGSDEEMIRRVMDMFEDCKKDKLSRSHETSHPSMI